MRVNAEGQESSILSSKPTLKSRRNQVPFTVPSKGLSWSQHAALKMMHMTMTWICFILSQIVCIIVSASCPKQSSALTNLGPSVSSNAVLDFETASLHRFLSILSSVCILTFVLFTLQSKILDLHPNQNLVLILCSNCRFYLCFGSNNFSRNLVLLMTVDFFQMILYVFFSNWFLIDM